MKRSPVFLRDNYAQTVHRTEVGKKTYVFSLCVWIANLIWVTAALFFRQSMLVFFIFLAAIFVEGFVSEAIGGEKTDPVLQKKHRRALDIAIDVLHPILLLALLFCMGGLASSGGGPEMRDGAYCIVSHGEMGSPKHITACCVCAKQSCLP